KTRRMSPPIAPPNTAVGSRPIVNVFSGLLVKLLRIRYNARSRQPPPETKARTLYNIAINLRVLYFLATLPGELVSRLGGIDGTTEAGCAGGAATLGGGAAGLAGFGGVIVAPQPPQNFAVEGISAVQ